MNKSKFAKILITALTFCLLLGAIVGITASASGETVTPEIIASNVEYSSRTYLYYAVPVDSIPEADRNAENGFWLEVRNTDGSLVFSKVYPEAETSSKPGVECYIFKTRGVPAKELNTKEVVQVITASGAKSESVTWSVEDYLYGRLYGDKFATKTEADGDDYLKRTLYYDLLKYGAIAQELLCENITDAIGDTAYADVPAAVATLGKLDQGDYIRLEYDQTTEASGVFAGWDYTKYDSNGEVVMSGYAQDGSSFYVDGYFTATPVYGAKVNHNYITFDDGTTGTVTTSVETVLGKVGGGSAGIIDGKFVANKTMTLTELKTAVANWNADENNANNQLTAPDSTAVSTYVSANTTVAGANVVELETDFSFKNNGGKTLEYIEIMTGKTASSPGSRMYRAYVTISGNYLQITNEYIPSAVAVNILTPLKVDGTVHKLKMRYVYIGDGTGYLEYYADGEKFYTTTNFYTGSELSMSQIGSIRFVMSNNPKATITLDNVAMTQVYDENANIKFEKVVANPGAIEFGPDYTSKVTVSTNKDFAALNTWEVQTDSVTGDKVLFIDKAGKDTSGTTYNGGVTFKTSVTNTEANANTMVYGYDITMKNMTACDSQMTMNHSGKDGKKYSPFLFSLPKIYNQKLRVEIIYRPTTITDGVVTAFEASFVINGEVIETVTEIYSQASELLNGNVALPQISSIDSITSALNNSFLGDAYIDNVSLELLYIEGNNPTIVTNAE